ncbi:hypothetical protein ACFX19_042183 [Malus domestica]
MDSPPQSPHPLKELGLLRRFQELCWNLRKRIKSQLEQVVAIWDRRKLRAFLNWVCGFWLRGREAAVLGLWGRRETGFDRVYGV